MTGILTKQCSKCKLIKPLSEFHINRAQPSGHHPRCKTCISEDGVKHRHNNKEMITAKQAQYYQSNKSKLLVYQTQYREDNKEAIAICNAKYRLNNKEKISAQRQQYKLDNKDKVLAQRAAYRKKHHATIVASRIKNRPKYMEKIRITNARYAKNNPGKVNAQTAKRRAAKLQRTPAWADLEAIKRVYLECEEVNLAAKTAGCTETFVVDHEIPLQGELVSGLHVENNLQIITLIENASKNNKFTPGHL